MPNTTTIILNGVSKPLAVGPPAVIWQGPGDWVPPSEVRTFEVVSSDAQDNPAGTGTGSIRVLMLDESCKLVVKTVPLNGDTPVEIGQGWRIVRVEPAKAGAASTTELNAGVITVRATAGPSPVQAQISVDNGAGVTVSQLGFFSTGKTPRVTLNHITLSLDANGAFNNRSVVVRVFERKMFVNKGAARSQILSHGISGSGSNPAVIPVGKVLDPCSDFIATATSPDADTVARITFNLSLSHMPDFL